MMHPSPPGPDRRRAGPLGWLRLRIASNVRSALGGAEEDLVDYIEPTGDAGLFGPGAPAWIVHGDLPSMLYGGFAALMLQTLSPRTMAGVAQHSSYQVDPTGRLKRTARFVAGTTFGPMPFVDQLFGEVKAVHSRVHGTTAAGEAYSANDPDLLTWVHVTEVSNFLHAYDVYGRVQLSPVDRDRYFAETSVIANRLGAVDVPCSEREVRKYLAQVRPTLKVTPDAVAAVRFLVTNAPARDRSLVLRLANVVVHRVVIEAAIDLLPADARAMLGLDRGARLKAAPRRFAARCLAGTFRWALGPSLIALTSQQRIDRASSPG